MDDFLIKNNDGKSFLLKEYEKGVYIPKNEDEGYALLFDILKSNNINFVIGIKNKYFIETLYYKNDIKNIVFLLNNILNINNDFIKNKYFINNSCIENIKLNINFEFLKKKNIVKEIAKEDDFMYSMIFFNVDGNNVDFTNFKIYSIESDMEIDVNDFLLFNSHTNPILNKKDAINTLLKLIFNEDFYIDINYFENKMKEYGYSEHFNTIIENSVYQPITKKKYNNVFATTNDLFIINEFPDNTNIKDINIKENLRYSPKEIFNYYGLELTESIKNSEYYMYSIYLGYIIINICKYYQEYNNINIQEILFLINKNNINVGLMNNLLYNIFEPYITKIDNIETGKMVFNKYITTLLSKI